MILNYRFRLLPTKTQHRKLDEILESQRLLYNAALEERIGAYRKADISISYFDQTRALTQWRREDPDPASLPANLQRATLKRLDRAYQAFFRRLKAGRKPGFPRFRGKGWFDSFGFQSFSGITLSNGRLRFKGLPGALRVHFHRQLPAVPIKSCMLRRDVKGWTVSFAISVEPAETRPSSRAIGIDLGIEPFATLSDGSAIPSLRAARASQRRMRIAQRALARKAIRSSGRIRARAEVRRCHTQTVNRRMTFLHQTTARLVRDFDLIAWQWHH